MIGRFRHELLLFGVVLFAVAYFYNGANWNQRSRLDAIFAFVEPGHAETGSFCIDRFLPNPEIGINTGDWSRNPRTGNYYSNKAPGPAMLGVPVYFLLFHGERMIGADPTTGGWLLFNGYALSVVLSGLPAAIAIVCFLALLVSLGVTRRRAFLLCLVLFFGTLLFPFSTQLWGHSTAAAFVIVALLLFQRESKAAMFGVGFCIGWAVLCEYTCAVILLTLIIALGCRQRWRQLLWMCLGGLLPLLLFAVYHHACFDSFFALASVHNNPRFRDAGAVAGLFGCISPDAVLGLSVSPYRGLFFFMPVLLLSLYSVFRKGVPRDRLYWLCIVNIALFFVINAMFNGWHAGSSTGARYQIPVLCFYVLLLTRLPDKPWTIPVLATLLVLSAVNMTMIAAVNPMMPSGYADPSAFDPRFANPLALVYRLFWLDMLTPDILPIGLDTQVTELVRKYSTFNLGELVGLPGKWSTLPWLVITGVGVWLGLKGEGKPASNEKMLQAEQLRAGG